MKRLILLSIVVMSVFHAPAQENLGTYLNRLFDMQDNPQAIREALSKIQLTQIATAPDSVKFDYYYLFAGVDVLEDKHTPEKIEYLLNAKHLCEKSLGIFRHGYLEIVNALGQEYEELGDYDQAQSYYQEGIIKGIYQRRFASNDFASLHKNLVDIYIKKGWDNDILQLCRDAWDYWDKTAIPFETYNFYPIWRLYQYQISKKKYSDAFANIEFAEDYIVNHTNGLNSGYIQLLYDKGYVLGKLNQHSLAIQVYQKAIDISKKIDYRKDLAHLYGNLIASLCNIEDTVRLDSTLQEVFVFAPQKQNMMDLYANALYHCGESFQGLRKYRLARKYAIMLPTLYDKKFLSAEEIDECNKQIQMIECRLENEKKLGSLIAKKSNYRKGTEEWIKYQNELANAYYVDLQKDKAIGIIEELLQFYIEQGNEHSEEFLYAVNRVVNTSQEIGDNMTMLKYGYYRLNITRSKFGIDSKEFGIAVNQQFVAALLSGNVVEAIKMADLTKQFFKVLYKDDPSMYYICLHNIGRANQISGDIKEAKKYYVQSIEFAKQHGLKVDDKTIQYLSEVNETIKEQL